MTASYWYESIHTVPQAITIIALIAAPVVVIVYFFKRFFDVEIGDDDDH